MHVPRNPQYNMHICDMGGRVGWGGAITFMSTWARMECYAYLWYGGEGWGGVGWGNNVHVNLSTHGMLCISVIWGGRVGWGRAVTFMSTWTPTSCYALGSSLALAHTQTHVMLRSGIFSCTCTHTSCYALASSLALAHTHHATLWDFSCTCTHTNTRHEIYPPDVEI